MLVFPDTTQTQDAIFTPGPSGIDIVPIYTDNGESSLDPPQACSEAIVMNSCVIHGS